MGKVMFFKESLIQEMTKFPGVFDSIKNYIWKFEFNFKFIDP